MSMRVTQRSGRCGSAKHNDRSFLQGRDAKETAPHIDQERTKDNVVVGTSKGDTLEEQELNYYRKHYGQALEARNARYREQRHPEKCRTIEDVYRNEKTRPRETILQIGDMNEGVSVQKLEECFKDYLNKLKEWNKAHGDHLKILNFAVHTDEASPHIHLRSVWEYTDKDGNKDLGQNKALEQAGVKVPDQDKPIGRYNNRMMTFEAETREMWQDICKSHGLEIETEPRPRRKHLDKADYIAEQKQAEIEKLEALEAQKQKDLDNTSEALKKAQKDYKTIDSKIKPKQDKLEALNSQIDISRDELRNILDKKARASEIKKPLFHKVGDSTGTVTYNENMLDSTRAIGQEAYRDLKKAQSERNEAVKERKEAERVRTSIEPRLKEVEKKEKAVADKEKNLDANIDARAQEKFNEFINQEFARTGTKREKKLEKFLDTIQLSGGKSALELFEQKEAELIQNLNKSWDISR